MAEQNATGSGASDPQPSVDIKENSEQNDILAKYGELVIQHSATE